MTREEIQSLKPGYYLDALVAEKIMGWTKFGVREDGSHNGWNAPFGYTSSTMGYSKMISAAWEVEEKIKELRLHVKYCQALKEVVISTGEYVGLFDYIHATPEQRCKSALLAVLEG